MSLWAGFDVGGQAVKAVVIDARGGIVARAYRDTGIDTDVDRLGARIRELSAELSALHEFAERVGDSS